MGEDAAVCASCRVSPLAPSPGLASRCLARFRSRCCGDLALACLAPPTTHLERQCLQLDWVESNRTRRGCAHSWCLERALECRRLPARSAANASGDGCKRRSPSWRAVSSRAKRIAQLEPPRLAGVGRRSLRSGVARSNGLCYMQRRPAAVVGGAVYDGPACARSSLGQRSAVEQCDVDEERSASLYLASRTAGVPAPRQPDRAVASMCVRAVQSRLVSCCRVEHDPN